MDKQAQATGMLILASKHLLGIHMIGTMLQKPGGTALLFNDQQLKMLETEKGTEVELTTKGELRSTEGIEPFTASTLIKHDGESWIPVRGHIQRGRFDANHFKFNANAEGGFTAERVFPDSPNPRLRGEEQHTTQAPPAVTHY